MKQRFRQQDSVYTSGGRIERRSPSGSLVSRYTQPRIRIEKNYCLDWVCSRNEEKMGELLIDRSWCSPGLSGTYPVGSLGSTMVLTDYIPESYEGTMNNYTDRPYNGGVWDKTFNNHSYAPHLSNLDGFTTRLTQNEADTMATEVLMRSNPSKPYVALPVFIGELRELPASIRDKGRHDIDVARRSSSNSIAVQFGIMPLVSDLLKLTHLSEQVDRKIAEISRMRETGGYRKKVWILKRNVTKQVSASSSINSRIVSFAGGPMETVTTNSIWGTVRWKVDGSKLPPAGSNEERSLIKATLQGMTSRKNLTAWLSDTWELMPWSWLIDWCGNIGDYLQAHASALPAEPSDVHIMQHIRTERTHGPFLGGQYFFAGQEQKYRFKATPSITLSLPFLSAKQMSILTGLSLSRKASPLRGNR